MAIGSITLARIKEQEMLNTEEGEEFVDDAVDDQIDDKELIEVDDEIAGRENVSELIVHFYDRS